MDFPACCPSDEWLRRFGQVCFAVRGLQSDLTAIQQRTELRHPPGGTGGGYGGVGIGDGAPDRRDPHGLGAYLLSVSPTEINTTQPFEAEFRILNTGLAPMEIPVSPHLSDLQPGDEAAQFSYFSIALVVQVEGDWRHPAFAIVELYGAKEHEGTILVLRPGEWIRVKAKMQPRYEPPESAGARLVGAFWLRRNTFMPHAGGEFTKVENLYPNVTSTPSIPVRILPQPTQPKRSGP